MLRRPSVNLKNINNDLLHHSWSTPHRMPTLTDLAVLSPASPQDLTEHTQCLSVHLLPISMS